MLVLACLFFSWSERHKEIRDPSNKHEEYVNEHDTAQNMV